MSETMSSSTLLIGEDYTYRLNASSTCFLGTDKQPHPVPRVFAADPEFYAAGSSFDWQLSENDQGALQLRYQGSDGYWMRGLPNGSCTLTGDPTAGIHFRVTDASIPNKVLFEAVHNQDGSTMTAGKLYQQGDNSNWAGVGTSPSAPWGHEWTMELISVAPSPYWRWRDTYQPALRHSASYFLNRILGYLSDPNCPHPPGAPLKLQLEHQLNHGINNYDPSATGATPEATVDAGLLTAHGGFYNDNEPDDELKQPPDWDKVKEGLDDAGFPTGD